LQDSAITPPCVRSAATLAAAAEHRAAQRRPLAAGRLYPQLCIVQLTGPDGGIRLALHDAQLRVEAASGEWSALRGAVFSRGGEGCR